jgi:hypothetical protein
MEVSVDPESPKKYIKIVSVTEILLPSPMLNMIIVNTKIDHNKTHFTENCNSGKYSYLIIYGMHYNNAIMINV